MVSLEWIRIGLSRVLFPLLFILEASRFSLFNRWFKIDQSTKFRNFKKIRDSINRKRSFKLLHPFESVRISYFWILFEDTFRPIGPDSTQISVTQFGSRVKHEYTFENTQNYDFVTGKIKSIKSMQGKGQQYLNIITAD